MKTRSEGWCDRARASGLVVVIVVMWRVVFVVDDDNVFKMIVRWAKK